VIHIDDLDWADRESRSLLDELLAHPDAPAVFWALTRRSGAETGLFSGRGELGQRMTRIEIEGLPRAQAKALARALLDEHRAAGAALLDELVAEADGHPVLLTELALHVAEVDVPGDREVRIEDVVGARLASLPCELRRLL